MSKHNKIGIKGEVYGAEYLLNKGYSILHRNWRSGKKEIDIIALKDDTLVIVEVKTRSGLIFGFPEDAVNITKQNYIKEAATAFLEQHPQYAFIRFDVLSIMLEGERIKEIVHYEGAFV